MSASVLRRALLGNEVEMVEMNRVGELVFGKDQKWCLGTTGLGACTVIILLSTKATILAHIAPRKIPDLNPSLPTGDENARDKLQEVTAMFIELQPYFTSAAAPGSVLVFGVNPAGEPWLPDQKRILEEQLTKWQLPAMPIEYHSISSPPNFTGKGEVLVDARVQGKAPVVWVEDKEYDYKAQIGSFAAASSKT
ncbi:MAG: hypothetical protein Q9195_008143 [Heterodermia aff. obscurata]